MMYVVTLKSRHGTVERLVKASSEDQARELALHANIDAGLYGYWCVAVRPA